jgi:hypothetical protein
MNGATGREREERAVDALLISALRQEDSEGGVDAKNLPELTEEERAAMKALGGNFIQRLLAGERPLGVPPGESQEDCPEESEDLALAGSGADYSLNRAEEVDDETAKELDQREREILERKARERKERRGGEAI